MPRYVGNRLHILFHLSGVMFSKRPDLLLYLKKYCTSQQLRLSLLSDLQNEDISVQLQALGLFGKLLTGPWMKELYCGEEEMSHMEGTSKLIRHVENLRSVEADPSILVSSTDCLFGEPLQDDDETLRQLRAVPSHHAEVLPETIKKLAGAFVVLLDRQLLRYLQGPLSEPTPSLLDVTSAAPVHNMLSERTLGRLDAQFRRAPNATIGFLDGKVKWQANKTAEWLNSKPSAEQHEIVSFAISQGARNRSALKQKEQENTNVKRQRQVELAQRRDRTDRKKVEVTDFLTTGTEGDLFCDLSEDMVHLFHSIKNTDSAAVSGVKCTHTWDVDGEDVIFQAELLRFETFKRKPCLVITYQEDATTASTESKIPVSEFFTDALFNDVTLL
ncbi:uncharacterized protein LOC101853268 [Aplysia californica]|uniref:Uncharacterized protein LOC101853268 n=1 Tax=Aplysia californica TaxID=6500 RepID=A0ABM1VP41_APLCA|nr:uncharacterized protein LOC101853268 [Aplysia californica]XP_035824206.1 uncharacterized protein LOC101853268 [Aplysia californica]